MIRGHKCSKCGKRFKHLGKHTRFCFKGTEPVPTPASSKSESDYAIELLISKAEEGVEYWQNVIFNLGVLKSTLVKVKEVDV